MHLTSPQVVGRRSDFSDGDRLAYALLWRSGIQVDPFQRALWNSRGFSSEKELIEKMLLRVNKIVDSWFKDGDSGTGQFTVLLIRDTDLAETPDDAELNRIDLALREGAGEKAENSDRGRIVSIGIWIHRDQDWFEIEKGEEEAEKNSKKVSTSATERQEDVEVNKQPAPIATPTTSSSSGGGSDPQKGNNYLSDLFRRWQTKFLLGKAHYGKYHKRKAVRGPSPNGLVRALFIKQGSLIHRTLHPYDAVITSPPWRRRRAHEPCTPGCGSQTRAVLDGIYGARSSSVQALWIS